MEDEKTPAKGTEKEQPRVTESRATGGQGGSGRRAATSPNWAGPQGRSVSQSAHPVPTAAGPHVAWAAWDLWLPEDTDRCRWAGGDSGWLWADRGNPHHFPGDLVATGNLPTRFPHRPPWQHPWEKLPPPLSPQRLCISCLLHPQQDGALAGQEGRNPSIEMALGRESATLGHSLA